MANPHSPCSRSTTPILSCLTSGCRTSTGSTCDAALLQRSDPPVVLLTSSRVASAYGARLLELAPIHFVPKDELSVAALVDLLPPD